MLVANRFGDFNLSACYTDTQKFKYTIKNYNITSSCSVYGSETWFLTDREHKLKMLKTKVLSIFGTITEVPTGRSKKSHRPTVAFHNL
jgi:hypothetical protein